MSFSQVLYTILIKPLQLLFEVIYVTAEKAIGSPGLAIIILSLVVNFLVLPLYLRADAMQKEERDVERKLEEGVKHIKKTFRGNERVMMLQTYYRQNHYKPFYTLRGAVSLFLQIPFFMAAYQFLSGLCSLNGVSFGPVKDLGQPDGMLLIDGIEVSLLPVIMTVVNLVSCMVFSKDSTVKSRMQLYIMAFLFYLILFNSPSGLVFYWTLNNIFSLVKTIVTSSHLFRRRKKIRVSAPKADAKVFFTGAVFLAVLTGILVPSAVIASSPQEFVILGYFYKPMELVGYTFCLATGVFCLWAGIYYWLAKPSARVWFDRAVWVLSGVMAVDYLFFGKQCGILDSSLRYEKKLSFAVGEVFGNALILFLVAALFCFIAVRGKKFMVELLAAGSMVFCFMSVLNAEKISDSTVGLKNQSIEKDVKKAGSFSLSKKGKNVVVLMLDRAMGLYVPYIFQEKPELKEQFAGFTWYSNVVSFGKSTNFGSPALFGGYDYTPEEMNKRGSEPLVKKHNEALKVMPVLFDENGYDVTVCDPPYANYQWIADLSIYDEYPDIKAKMIVMNQTGKKQLLQERERNLFCYSIMKSMPLLLQKPLYDTGNYLQADKGTAADEEDMEAVSGDSLFVDNYQVLSSLPGETDITDNGAGTFLMMTNNITHSPAILQEPDYTPADKVDNAEYDRTHQNRFDLNGQKLDMENEQQVMHYHINMAAMLQLGKWFDYLRENDVYDNTRIILVSDHGRDLYHTENLLYDDGMDLCGFYPLLMVKDFGSRGFMTSEEFMTNGDVPALAMDGLITNPVNPFTGNLINSDAKKKDKQYIFCSGDWDVETNNGNTFHPGTWFYVHDDMRDKNNWEKVAEDRVLPAGK